jgi:hypothetical protein
LLRFVTLATGDARDVLTLARRAIAGEKITAVAVHEDDEHVRPRSLADPYASTPSRCGTLRDLVPFPAIGKTNSRTRAAPISPASLNPLNWRAARS